MDILGNVPIFLEEVETTTEYRGYWYKVTDILTITACGLLCSLRNMKLIHKWATSGNTPEFLRVNFGIRKIPCYAQFVNILGIVNSQSFIHAFTKWAHELAGSLEGKTIAVDGKTVCSTEKMQSFESALHIASAYVSELGITIGMKECAAKTNEIKAVQELLETIDVKGTMVATDALNCQKKTAKNIVEKGGDYLFVVKKNHPNLYEDIREMLEFKQNDKCEMRFSPVEKITQREKSHGRIESRTAIVTHDIEWLADRDKWVGLKCIGAVQNGRETRYYISSRALSAEEMLKFSRNEWGVESMHWLLDVHFGEDKTQSKCRNTQLLLNALRKTVLNLLKVYKQKTASKEPLSGIMQNCLFNSSTLLDILGYILRLFCVTDLLLN